MTERVSMAQLTQVYADTRSRAEGMSRWGIRRNVRRLSKCPTSAQVKRVKLKAFLNELADRHGRDDHGQPAAR
jgi:hypothetical protein